MEDKLIRVLLDQYKEQGIDMYALLDDNFFKGLNLQKKVDLIKEHAAHISENTGRGLSKRDIGALAIDGGIAGIATGLTAGLAAREAGKHFATGMTPWHLVAGAVALGAGMAAGTSYLNGHKRFKQRADILAKIDETVANPTDENALKVLVTRNNQLNPIARTSLQSTAMAHLGGAAKALPGTINRQLDPWLKFKSYEHNAKHNVESYAPGETQDSFFEAYENSGKDMLKTFNDSINTMKNQILGRN